MLGNCEGNFRLTHSSIVVIFISSSSDSVRDRLLTIPISDRTSRWFNTAAGRWALVTNWSTIGPCRLWRSPRLSRILLKHKTRYSTRSVDGSYQTSGLRRRRHSTLPGFRGGLLYRRAMAARHSGRRFLSHMWWRSALPSRVTALHHRRQRGRSLRCSLLANFRHVHSPRALR